jgi:hypothetical protein
MTRDPQTLHPHPAIKAMPRWAKGSEEWRAFVDDIRENGITHPVLVTHDGVVIDGWTRITAARDLQLATVPVREVAADEAVQIIVREMCLRRNLTKGQRAYLAWPMFKALHAELQARHIESLKAGKISTLSPTFADSIGKGPASRHDDALGARIGVSGDLLSQARQLHAIFDGTLRKLPTHDITEPHDDLKRYWEPRILDLDKPIGLGAAIAGIAGKEATEGREKGVSPLTQLSLFDQGLGALKTVFATERWEKTPERVREQALTDFRLASAAWSPALRREIGTALLQSADEDPAA